MSVAKRKKSLFQKEGSHHINYIVLQKNSLLNFQKGLMMGKNAYNRNQNFPAAAQYYFKCNRVVNQRNSRGKVWSNS